MKKSNDFSHCLLNCHFDANGNWNWKWELEMEKGNGNGNGNWWLIIHYNKNNGELVYYRVSSRRRECDLNTKNMMLLSIPFKWFTLKTPNLKTILLIVLTQHCNTSNTLFLFKILKTIDEISRAKWFFSMVMVW